jgi:adenylate cyclase
VQGSLRQALDDIRVNVQLVDTTIDEEVWAKRFDDSFENIFDIQDEIILEILKFLNLKVTKKPKSKEGTTNFEAYDMFLQAEHRRLNRRGTKSDPRILKLYSIAIELDPQYVDAYTGLAREALFNWQLGDNEIMSMEDWKNQVYENAGKARALDPENVEALAILGLLQAAGGAHDAGIDSIESALLSNPDNPQLYADLATVLSYGGRHDEALNSINRAIDRHAKPPTTYFAERARINFFLENYGNALKDAENDQDISDVKNFSLFILGALNKREAAQRLVKIRLELRPWENQDYYRTLFAYYRRPQDIELIVKSAAKAGIP